MRAYLQQLAYRIRGSYWFIPSLMVLSAALLSQASIWADRSIGNAWLQQFWFTSLNQPDGARALLATVAGSMITVAGVTFSLTILAVSHATSHFGPRLLDNFMRDRGNQVTLGTFVATFLYCLLVLRVVRGVGVPGEAGPNVGVFVPQLSLILALVLTLASVAELIYFIHHVPESIHISTVLQRLATDMSQKLDELYPETVGQPIESERQPEAPPLDFEREITSSRSGYLQGVDDAELLGFATTHDTVLKLCRRPGDFIREDEVIAQVGPIDDWSEAKATQVRHAFAIGFTRTPTQDAFFVLNEFVEVAVRALSPGVNDPFTAMQCIDWLSVGLAQVSKREMPPRLRTDPQGDVRIVTTIVTHADFVDAMVGQLVPYARADENVKRYLKSSMERVLEISPCEPLNARIREKVQLLSL